MRSPIESTGQHVNPGDAWSLWQKSPQRTGAKCLLDRTILGSHVEPQFEGIVTAQNRQSQSFGLGPRLTH